jgi:hypothetical protein
MSESNTHNLVEHLEQVKQQYQQQSLISRLEELANDLRELLLEKAVAETVLDYDAGTYDELREQVQRLNSAAEAGDLETVSEHIEEAEDAIDAAESRMQGNRADPQSAFLSRLDSMEQLNEQLAVVDQATLRELKKLAEESRWTTELDIEDDTPIEEAINTAIEFGNTRRQEYEAAEQAIFKPYLEGELADIVEGLLSDSPPMLCETDSETIDKLSKSDLGKYIALRFD